MTPAAWTCRADAGDRRTITWLRHPVPLLSRRRTLVVGYDRGLVGPLPAWLLAQIESAKPSQAVAAAVKTQNGAPDSEVRT